MPWRLTTAVRVFAVALATGQTLGADRLQSLGMMLLSIGIVAGFACFIELDPTARATRWTPLVEGVVVAVLVSSPAVTPEPVLVYLAVPAAIAGMRNGIVSALNATLATSVAAATSLIAAHGLPMAQRPTPYMSWLTVGAGIGVLVAVLGRSARAAESERAPYVSAHRLLRQLHAVSRHLSGDLDSRQVGSALLSDLQMSTGAESLLLLIRLESGRLVRLSSVGEPTSGEHAAASEAAQSGHRVRYGRIFALPIRVDDRIVGAAALYRPSPLSVQGERKVATLVGQHALRLDSAMLFEDVRHVAANEERSRIAREIHDGVAQEVASLGYVVDELVQGDTADTKAIADYLREEISRIVGELRLSIFDLRHEVGGNGGLAGAVAAYAREAGARGDLRVHLVLEEQGLDLPPHVESELLRIAQEAIGNVRKHARAKNLWVALTSKNGSAILEVEDDGKGAATPRAGHYGLPIMDERAKRIAAQLSVTQGPRGGTSMKLTLSPNAPSSALPTTARSR